MPSDGVENLQSRRLGRWAEGRSVVLALVLVAGLIKGGLIAWATPPFQTPDEYGHYDYVLYLSHVDLAEFLRGNIAKPTRFDDVTTKELWAVTAATGTETHLRHGRLHTPMPAFRAQVAAARGFVPADEDQALRTRVAVPPQFNYPILYYGACALVVKAVRWWTPNPVVAYYVVRWTSLIVVLATVAVLWLFLRAGMRTEDWRPMALALVFAALQPELGMLGTSVQSDVMTVFLVTLSAYAGLVYSLRRRARDACWFGVVVGLLLLTKVHAAAPTALAFGALAFAGARDVGVRRVGKHLAIAGTAAVLVGGWWYVRSSLLFGSVTGMVGDFRTGGFGTRRQNVMAWLSQWPLTVKSFWGMWGWLEVSVADVYYWVLSAALIGTCALCVLRPRQGSGHALERWVVWYPVTLTVCYAAVMVVVAATVGPYHNSQGRHWLPVIVLPSVALAIAGQRCSERGWRHLGTALVVMWTILLVSTNGALVAAMLGKYW